jgi:hypothetical protein
MPVVGSYNVPLSPGTGVDAFYTDPQCSGGTTGNANFIPNQAHSVVYMKMNSSFAPAPMFGGTSLINSATGSGVTYSTLSASGSANSYNIYGSSITTRGACEPMLVVRTDANGAAVPTASPLNLMMSQSGMGAVFYPTSDCSGAPQSNFMLNTNQSAQVIYYRAQTFVSGTGSISVMDNDGTPLSGSFLNMSAY